MASITSANSVVVISVPGVINSTQLQGFAADDIFNTDVMDIKEILMGVDGKLSAGFVNVPVVQNFMLQADSLSNAIFDTWRSQERAVSDVLFANGVITLTAINLRFTLTKGVMTKYKPMADAKKVLQPRTFTIAWESVTPALI